MQQTLLKRPPDTSFFQVRSGEVVLEKAPDNVVPAEVVN